MVDGQTFPCPKCGGPVPDGEDLCPHCQVYISKYRLLQERRSTATPPVADPPRPDAPSSTGTKPLLNILALIIVVGVITYHFASPYLGPGKSFPVAKLTVDESGHTQAGPWQESREIGAGRTLHVLVAASWCPYCQQEIARLGKSPGDAALVDMIVFYEDEAERLIRRSNLPAEQTEELLRNYASEGRILEDAGKLAPYNLPYYLIKKGEFGSLITGYPTYLACGRKGCRVEN